MNTKRALLVGINYTGGEHALNGCINDVASIKTYLLRRGFQEEHIEILTDDTEEKPTRRNILMALTRMILSGSKVMFFHYSGHGSYLRDVSGDEQDGYDECLVPLDYSTAGMVTDDHLRSVLGLMRGNQQITCLLDCCHSGTGIDMGWNVYMDMSKNLVMMKDSNYSQLDGSIVMFSGCQDNQYSADAWVENKYQGAMTWAFLACVGDYGHESISYRKALEEIRKTLKRSHFEQVPSLSSNYCIDLDWAF